MKQVPLHPQERLKRKGKTTNLDNCNHLSKKRKNEDATFIKQVPLHQRKRLQRLANIDEKVHFIKEVASTKPKNLFRQKEKFIK